MFEKFTRSWDLTKQSWSVLRENKQLMMFPLISSALTIAVSATFILPPAIMIAMTKPAWLDKKSDVPMPLEWRIGFFVGMFLLYFATSSIISFFNASLIACAINSFEGKDSSAAAGMRIARSRLPQILGWAFINATVGVIIQSLRERAGWIGEKILGLVGLAWNVATFFVVPVLVIEGVGPIDACRRSFEIIRKSWGESLVTQAGVGLVFGILTLIVIMIPAIGGIAWSIAADSPWPAIVLGCLGVLAAILLGLIASTLKMILAAACYRYATTGEAPFTFQGETLKSMFGPKK